MKKIFFNDFLGITDGVIKGNITQAISIPKIQPPYLNSKIEFPTSFLLSDEPEKDPLFEAYRWYNEDNEEEYTDWIRPKYRTGEIVAIAQSYKDLGIECYYYRDTDEFMFFMQDGHDVPISPLAVENKCFVNAKHMPHRLRIENVRIRRLKDISDDDCLRQGVELNKRQYDFDGTKYYCVRGLGHWRGIGCYNFNSPREAYSALIDNIFGKATWDRNPYVFIYDFKLVK